MTTKINIDEIVQWQQARKTKGLVAKYIKKDVTLMKTDETGVIYDIRIINTLEGPQNIRPGSFICIGPTGDIWQQNKKNLFKKYNVVDVDENGWLICEPKPDNEADCVEIVIDDFYIIGQWGEKTPEGFVQRGSGGDYVFRNQVDHTDIWIVNKKVFENTYTIIN